MKENSQLFLHMSHNTLPGMPAPVLISYFPDMPTADSSDCRVSAGEWLRIRDFFQDIQQVNII